MTENNEISAVFSKIIEVNISQLYLDPNNYRLISNINYRYVPDSDIVNEAVQQKTLSLISGPGNERIQDLISSFKTNGYLPADLIQVIRLSHDKYLVLDGNRRTAALKALEAAHETSHEDLQNFDIGFLKRIPVVCYSIPKDTADLRCSESASAPFATASLLNDKRYLTVMALKHITGNMKWGEWNQALLIRNLLNAGKMNEDEICSSIGIDKTSLRRNIRAIGLVEQYQDSDYGDQFSAEMFSIFREIVSYPAIRNWLDWDDNDGESKHRLHTEQLFSLMSRDTKRDEYENPASHDPASQEPAISRRDDVRMLAKIVADPKAMNNLLETRNISASLMVSQANEEPSIKKFGAILADLSDSIDLLTGMYLPKDKYDAVKRQINLLQSYLERNQTEPELQNDEIIQVQPSHQFSSLHIKKFKRFTNFTINSLKRINIFAGINNSGKSTVLEAIYLLCRQNDFKGLQEIIRMRGKIAERRIASDWLWDQIHETSISGTFADTQAAVDIHAISEDISEFDSASYLHSMEIRSSYGEISQKSRIRFFSDREREIYTDGTKSICRVIFSSPFFLNEPHRYSGFYYQAVRMKTLPKIISFIKDKILPSVTDIRLIDALRRFSVMDDNFSQAVDLSGYGEGVQRIFFISLLFASARDGVLLIDEFENAIHVDMMKDFAVFIDSLSKEFNVQVFLTSHSKECIDAFVENVPEDDVMCCALVCGNDQPIQYIGRIFKMLISTSDTDLRRTM